MVISDANKPFVLEHKTAIDDLVKGLLVDDGNPRRGQDGADKLQEICALVLQNLALTDLQLRAKDEQMQAKDEQMQAKIARYESSDFGDDVKAALRLCDAMIMTPGSVPASLRAELQAHFTDQQIADLWAAFQTVAPVAEAAPAHEVAFPFDQRWGLKLWRAAYLQEPGTEPVDGRGDLWNRGRELVRGAVHCGACHTDRNIAGARIVEAALAGSDDLPGGGKAPSIRSGTLKADGWTVSSLAYALRTGTTPSGDSFGGSMGEVVRQGTRFLTDTDRQAIATYLLDSEVGSATQTSAASTGTTTETN